MNTIQMARKVHAISSVFQKSSSEFRLNLIRAIGPSCKLEFEITHGKDPSLEIKMEGETMWLIPFGVLVSKKEIREIWKSLARFASKHEKSERALSRRLKEINGS